MTAQWITFGKQAFSNYLIKIQPAVSLRYDLKTNDVSSGLLWDYNEFVKHILEYQSVLKKRI